MNKIVRKNLISQELNSALDLVVKLVTLLGMLINLRISPTPYFL